MSDHLPDHLLELCVLPVTDAMTLFALARTSRALREMVRALLQSHMEAKKEVTEAIRSLRRIVNRDRSRRFRYVYEGVFHRWFFHTRLSSYTVWRLPDDPGARWLWRHPRPLGHAGRWCDVCGGTRACRHHRRL